MNAIARAARSLSVPGLALGTLAFAASTQPSLIPRGWIFAAAISAWPGCCRPRVQRGLVATLGVVAVVTTITGAASQRRQALLWGLEPTASAHVVTIVLASLSATGVTVASAASWASSRPTLAPRTWQTQSVVTGVSMMVGYWAGTRGGQIAQWLLPRLAPTEPARAAIRSSAVAGLVVTTASALVSEHRFEVRRAEVWGRDHEGNHLLAALPLAAFTAPILIQRGARRRVRALDAVLERWFSHPVAAVAGEALYLAGCARE